MVSIPAMRRIRTVAPLLLITACASQDAAPPPPAAAPATAAKKAEAPKALTAADADAFVADAEKQLFASWEYGARVAWINYTYINEDSDWLSAKADAEYTKLAVDLAKEAAKFNDVKTSPETARKLKMLKLALTLPAPSRDGAADELAQITTRLKSTYGKGKGTFKGKVTPGSELEALMRSQRDPKQLQEMWTSWRKISQPMRKDYVRMVEIANEGAKELGFDNVGAMWRSGYDMSPDEFSALLEKLWTQVKPIYDALHCYTRAKLNKKYGAKVVPLDKPIRADLLGNMWAQEWGSIYDDVAPKGAGDIGFDLTALLKKKKYDHLKMVKTGEAFFSSLGMPELPDTFWKRSMFLKPADREVVCHASAWDVDNKDDLRIKMCIKVDASDFQTIHHELGHNYYQRAYNEQSPLYLTGANDGFHEAIGDMIALSITPDYLVKIGLLDKKKIPPASKDIGLLLREGMDKVAFLPFGLIVDKWRWRVFSGEVAPDNYNAAWWELRTKYQGIRPPVERNETDFDPGAKYHIPGNTPYTRYFLARILQFQFHQAACKMAGWKGPLHRCSIYGNKEVGKKFEAMMAMGASKPWPDALEAFTGTREMDGTAMIAYFEPLMGWLAEQNKGQQCGW